MFNFLIVRLNIMTEDLSKKKCVPCEGGIPPFTIEQINEYLKKVDGWVLKQNEEMQYYLFKEFAFKDFLESQKFVNIVGDISETEGHHPDLTFGWGYATVKIFTLSIIGLAERDFILASYIDKKA